MQESVKATEKLIGFVIPGVDGTTFYGPGGCLLAGSLKDAYVHPLNTIDGLRATARHSRNKPQRMYPVVEVGKDRIINIHDAVPFDASKPDVNHLFVGDCAKLTTY